MALLGWRSVDQPETAHVPAAAKTADEPGMVRHPRGRHGLSRRDFIVATAAGGAGAVIAVVATDLLGDETPSEIATAGYPRRRIATVSGLSRGQPIDFDYPLVGQKSFLVKLGRASLSGAGVDQDIVAFSYLCTHMGCPLLVRFKEEHSVLGPCPCTGSGRSDQRLLPLPRLARQQRRACVHKVATDQSALQLQTGQGEGEASRSQRI